MTDEIIPHESPVETTTQAVDTAANDLRKDVENSVKEEAPIVITGFVAHVEAFGELAKEDIEAAIAYLKGKL